MHALAPQADEVVVVDNGSRAAAVAAQAEAAGARVVRTSRNLGYAGGVNVGAEVATGELIAMVNDDAVAEPGWLDAAESALDADPALAAVGPTVLLAGRFLEVVLDDEPWFAPGDGRPLGRRVVSVQLDGEELLDRCLGDGLHRVEHAGVGAGSPPERWRWSAGRLPFYVPLREGRAPRLLRVNGEETRWRREVDLVNSLGLYLRPDGYAGDIGAEVPPDGVPVGTAVGDAPRPATGLVERFGLSGVAVALRRDAWRCVGPLAASYFAYYEDVDWCWRARLGGWRLGQLPAALVRHERGATSGGLDSARVRFLAERNRLRTLARNAPLRVALGEAAVKRRGGGDDGVAEVLPGTLALALVERARLRTRWALPASAVYERWAGVDVPGASAAAVGAGDHRRARPAARGRGSRGPGT